VKPTKTAILGYGHWSAFMYSVQMPSNVDGSVAKTEHFRTFKIKWQ